MWKFSIVTIVVLVCISTVVGIFYCLTLQKTLSRCSPQNRTLSPRLVWLYFIPIFSLVWHFFIVFNLTKSLHAEFVTRTMVEDSSPGLAIGLATCILEVVAVVTSPVPFVGLAVSVAGLICWIVYWVKIAWYSDKIAVPYTAPQQPSGPAPVA